MHAKRPRQISRSTSMSRLHSCTLPENPSEKPGPAPAIDGRFGFQVSHKSTPPDLLQLNGIAEARREPTSPSPKNENPHQKLQFSEQYVISMVQDEMGDGEQLLDNEIESKLLPPSEPSHFAVQIGLYSVLEPRMEALSVNSNGVEAVSRDSKETARIECSSCAPLLEIDSAANEGAVDSRPLADFLDECFICKRQLGHGSDTYMYRGERAFCSMECRHYEILMEERSDQFFLTAFKKATPTHKRKIIANSSTTTCA